MTANPPETAPEPRADEQIRFVIAQTLASAWNNEWPIGTLVEYWPGERRPGRSGRRGHTRAVAQVLGGHTAVVWITGQTGAIALDHVRPIAHGGEGGNQ